MALFYFKGCGSARLTAFHHAQSIFISLFLVVTCFGPDLYYPPIHLLSSTSSNPPSHPPIHPSVHPAQPNSANPIHPTRMSYDKYLHLAIFVVKVLMAAGHLRLVPNAVPHLIKVIPVFAHPLVGGAEYFVQGQTLEIQNHPWPPCLLGGSTYHSLLYRKIPEKCFSIYGCSGSKYPALALFPGSNELSAQGSFASYAWSFKTEA